MTLLERYRNALAGIASCSTRCKCCEMHREVAERALRSSVPVVEDDVIPGVRCADCDD